MQALPEIKQPPVPPVIAEDTRRSVLKPKDIVEKKTSKGKVVVIAIILIFVILLGALISVVLLNPMNLREQYLRGIINKVPFMKTVIPAPEANVDDAPVYNVDELLSQITALERQLEQRENNTLALNERIAMLEASLEPQNEFNTRISNFNILKERFDRDTAMADTKLYESYFKQLHPELAEELYKDAVVVIENEKEVKDFVNMIKGMDAKNSAKAFEAMIDTNMDLIVKILKKLDRDTLSEIMNQMSVSSAAAIIRQMEPEGF